MINKLTVLNVGFGDSVVISGKEKNDEYKVLVDCGSKHRYDQSVVNYLNADLHANKVYGILSHFHDDHYKYLPKLNKLFDVFYVPNYLNNENIEIQIKIYLLIKNNPKIRKSAEAMLRLDKIVKCIKPNGKLVFISSDNNNHYSRIIDNYRVLWPLKNIENDDELNNSLNRFFTDDQLRIISGFTDRFFSLFNINDSGIVELNYGSDFSRLNELQDMIGSINESIMLDDVELDLSIIDGILRNQHKYCLVFDRVLNDSSNVLFLGDIDRDILQNNILPFIAKNEYRYTKVVHHGTDAYFLNSLPKSENFIISNKMWGRRESWRISKKFPLSYSETSFICTNNDGCSYYIENECKCINARECGFNSKRKDFFM